MGRFILPTLIKLLDQINFENDLIQLLKFPRAQIDNLLNASREFPERATVLFERNEKAAMERYDHLLKLKAMYEG